jgi:hypothetical protein
MSKPINERGGVCPLHNKYTNKVCHTCEWYVPVRRTKGPSTHIEYACSIPVFAELQSFGLARMDEVVKSNNEARNAFLDFKASILKLVTMLFNLRPHADVPLIMEDKGGKE